MLQIILPLLTMFIGFLMGIVVCDCYIEDERLEELEREVNKLKRRANRDVKS